MLSASGLPQMQAGTGADDVAKAQNALRGSQDGTQDPEEVGRKFEELFSTMLVREMRKSAKSPLSEGGVFGKGAGSDVYEGWFDENVGAALASQDSLGLVGMVKANVTRMQNAETK